MDVRTYWAIREVDLIGHTHEQAPGEEFGSATVHGCLNSVYTVNGSG
jgi:hypothetical protein